VTRIPDLAFRISAAIRGFALATGQAVTCWRATRHANALARRNRRLRRQEAQRRRQFHGVLISSSVGISTSKAGRKN